MSCAAVSPNERRKRGLVDSCLAHLDVALAISLATTTAKVTGSEPCGLRLDRRTRKQAALGDKDRELLLKVLALLYPQYCNEDGAFEPDVDEKLLMSTTGDLLGEPLGTLGSLRSRCCYVRATVGNQTLAGQLLNLVTFNVRFPESLEQLRLARRTVTPATPIGLRRDILVAKKELAQRPLVRHSFVRIRWFERAEVKAKKHPDEVELRRQQMAPRFRATDFVPIEKDLVKFPPWLPAGRILGRFAPLLALKGTPSAGIMTVCPLPRKVQLRDWHAKVN